MIATTTMTAPTAGTSLGEQRVILTGVSWHTYESLLADFADRSAPRFAYDQGVLEIISPRSEHEWTTWILSELVSVVAEEWAIEILGVGSMTYKRAAVQRGFEPDASFYIQHAQHGRVRLAIDPEVDPPPDLVIEIDISNSSLNKLPLYASLAVPELWRYSGGRVAILTLVGDRYQEAVVSATLPPLTAEVVNHLLGESRTLPWLSWRRTVRDWARTVRRAP